MGANCQCFNPINGEVEETDIDRHYSCCFCFSSKPTDVQITIEIENETTVKNEEQRSKKKRHASKAKKSVAKSQDGDKTQGKRKPEESPKPYEPIKTKDMAAKWDKKFEDDQKKEDPLLKAAQERNRKRSADIQNRMAAFENKSKQREQKKEEDPILKTPERQKSANIAARSSAFENKKKEEVKLTAPPKEKEEIRSSSISNRMNLFVQKTDEDTKLSPKKSPSKRSGSRSPRVANRASFFEQKTDDAKNLTAPKTEKPVRKKSFETANKVSIFEENDKKTKKKKKIKVMCPKCGKVIYPADPTVLVENEKGKKEKWHTACHAEVQRKLLLKKAGVDTWSDFHANVSETKLDVKGAENMWKKSEQDPDAKVSSICPTCGKTVLLHQRAFSFFGNHFHEGCYLCVNCDVILKKSQKITHRQKKPYCQKCYQEVFAEELKKRKPVPDSTDPVQVAGKGMDFDSAERGGDKFEELYKGIQTKRLQFITIQVEGDNLVYPDLICPFDGDASHFPEIEPEDMDKWLKLKITRKVREVLFAGTTLEEYNKFKAALTAGGPCIGWKTITYMDGDDFVKRARDKSFMIFWNPKDLDSKMKVVWSSVRDELGRRFGFTAWEAEEMHHLDFELILKKAQNPKFALDSHEFH